MKKYKCIIIDDEPLARNVIINLLQKHTSFEVVLSCSNVAEAFDLIYSLEIDLLFLDINLPGMNGIEFIRSLKIKPKVIFTTAYSEYGAESYELDAIDYLVKPVSAERFDRCIQKFLLLPDTELKLPENDFIFVKTNNRLLKINFPDILYFEARKDYLMVYTVHGSHLIYTTTKAMESQLPDKSFIRVHRSYIVARHAVCSISINELQIGNTKIPVGETYRHNILKLYS